MIRRISVLATVCLCLLFLSNTASAVGIEAALGVWGQDPTGDITFQGDATFDLDNELNYDDETKIMGRVKIETPGAFPNVYLMATPMKFEGNGSKSGTFTFEGTTFTGTFPFTSKLQLDQYDLCLYYNLPFIEAGTNGVVSAELGLDVRGVDLEAEIVQPGTGLAARENFFVPVPMIYLGVEVKPVRAVSIGAEVRGIAYSGSHAIDLIGRVKVNIAGPLFIAAGYRYEKIKIDHDDIEADVKIKGPFAEIGVTF
ncbi:MAG: TIGR04219 family outer membrane beta-barrel protein [Thermodesulfovibrionales bacterium]|jgi:outer membrane protein